MTRRQSRRSNCLRRRPVQPLPPPQWLIASLSLSLSFPVLSNVLLKLADESKRNGTERDVYCAAASLLRRRRFCRSASNPNCAPRRAFVYFALFRSRVCLPPPSLANTKRLSTRARACVRRQRRHLLPPPPPPNAIIVPSSCPVLWPIQLERIQLTQIKIKHQLRLASRFISSLRASGRFCFGSSSGRRKPQQFYYITQ